MKTSNILFIGLLSVGLCSITTRAAPQPIRTGVASPVIVVQNYYYAWPGKADEVYALRLRASDVRAELGLPRGRVLRRTHTLKDSPSSPPLADVIWECEYPTMAAREADVATLERSREFARIEKRMDTLLRKFQRGIFENGG